ncbi:MAG: SIR2 family protein [Mobilitalea sp.]
MKDKEFLFRLVNSKDVLLFIGAGFSIPSGLPSGNTLKEFLVEDLQKIIGLDMSDKSLHDVCDLLKNELGHVEFIKLLDTYLNKTSTDTSSHDLLAKIPFFENIVTTNYDSFIEDAFGDKCIVKVSDNELGIYEKRRVCIYKIHGDFFHPQRIVISKDDYARFSNDSNNLIWNEVKGLMSKKAILFIGYSIEDVHVYNYLFEIIRKIKKSNTRYRHAYFVAPDISKENKKLLRLRGVIPINSTGKDLLIELHNYLKSNIITSYFYFARLKKNKNYHLIIRKMPLK